VLGLFESQENSGTKMSTMEGQSGLHVQVQCRVVLWLRPKVRKSTWVQPDFIHSIEVGMMKGTSALLLGSLRMEEGNAHAPA